MGLFILSALCRITFVSLIADGPKESCQRNQSDRKPLFFKEINDAMEVPFSFH